MKEQYIKQVEKELSLPRKMKKEVVRDLNEVFASAMEHGETEQQIIQRDEFSWLIEGTTPIENVKHALGIEDFPDWDNYETLAGFMMYKLRKIPRPADFVEYQGYVAKRM